MVIIASMGTDPESAFTLTTMEGGQSARVPALRVSLTTPGRPPATATLGVHALVVGTSAECDLTAVDPRMSRRHCELRLTGRGVSLRDLGSKNGTFVGHVPVVEVFLPPRVPVKIGESTLVITPESGSTVLPLSKQDGFGEAAGSSTAMRAVFALLERAAPTDETILLLGESGTGKEVLAARAQAPWDVGYAVWLSRAELVELRYRLALGRATDAHADAVLAPLTPFLEGPREDPLLYATAARAREARAKRLRRAGQDDSAEITAGIALAEKAVEVGPGRPGRRAVLGRLWLLRARSTQDPAQRKEHARRAAAALGAALRENALLDRTHAALLAEASLLAGK